MNQQQQDLHEIEISEQVARQKVEKYKALQRLIGHPDWQRIIDNGYFVEEASRLVLTKSEPAQSTPEIQESYDKQIDAIGTFRQYLITILRKGEEMEAALKEFSQTREEILDEEFSEPETDLDEAV